MKNESLRNQLKGLGYQSKIQEKKNQIGSLKDERAMAKERIRREKEANRHRKQENKIAEKTKKIENRDKARRGRNTRGLTTEEFKAKLRHGTIRRAIGTFAGKAVANTGASTITKAMAQEYSSKQTQEENTDTSGEKDGTSNGSYKPYEEV